MNILVLNSGSSSIKFQLFDMKSEEVVMKGLIERVGLPDSIISYSVRGGDKKKEIMTIHNHKDGLKKVLEILIDPKENIIKSYKEINAAGHRYVHGGEKYKTSTLITKIVVDELEALNHLAPLHNPPNLTGVLAMMELMPDVPNVAVFDTSFHSKMPEKAYMYALPYEMYEKNGIRRYGFHGTSHQFVAMEAAKMLNKPFEQCKIVTCHMGNGTSYSAVMNGHSVDTSLGYSTMCGIPMGTRAGDVDAGIITHLLKTGEYSVDQMHDILYKKSGMLGISGVSSDARDVEDAAWNKGNKRAQLALDLIVYAAKKYIGGYMAAMNGADAIVFTAGIGENGWETREAICTDMDFLGISIDKEKNKSRGKKVDVSTADARVKVLVVPTNEELMIALETKAILSK